MAVDKQTVKAVPPGAPPAPLVDSVVGPNDIVTVVNRTSGPVMFTYDGLPIHIPAGGDKAMSYFKAQLGLSRLSVSEGAITASLLGIRELPVSFPVSSVNITQQDLESGLRHGVPSSIIIEGNKVHLDIKPAAPQAPEINQEPLMSDERFRVGG